MTDKLECYASQVKEKWSETKKLEQEIKDYCENKKFQIVKNIYYSGYQNNLKGRECIIHPFIFQGELFFSCTVYNKKTKKIDINHNYGHSFDYYKEL